MSCRNLIKRLDKKQSQMIFPLQFYFLGKGLDEKIFPKNISPKKRTIPK